MRSDVSEKFFFRKFPDLNKCHAYESKCFPSFAQMMTKVYRFTLMAPSAKYYIVSEILNEYAGALINDKIWREEVKEEHQKRWKMKIC